MKKKLPEANVANGPKTFLVIFKENVAKTQCYENSKTKILREFKVTNCWNRGKSDWNNLAYYNLTKSVVDGDKLQVYWITQKLKSFTKKWEKKHFFFKSWKLYELNVAIGQEKNCRGEKKTRKSWDLSRNIQVLLHFLPANFPCFKLHRCQQL